MFLLSLYIEVIVKDKHPIKQGLKHNETNDTPVW